MKWKILPRKKDDLTEQLLINRGIKSEKEREGFFHPNLENFEKELQIPGIPKAKKRIEKAIKYGELIIAYGDYDVDGICGAAVLYLGLTAMGAKVLPYIPHREKEGYGLSKQGLEFARDSGAGLVISTDTGIVAFEMAVFAKEIGLDLIITDHHQTLDGKYPDCFAIVHSTELCGAAVAWTLIRDDKLLDLVAMATISDMMPLLEVNRALVKRGLEILNKQSLLFSDEKSKPERVGLQALYEEAGITPGKIGSYEVGHIIAPRLNAMGRLEHAIDSLRLLCTKDREKARKLAKLVAETNDQRKLLTQTAVDEAKLKVSGSTKKIHVLSSTGWVPGIVGLVAGRVSEETKVPVIAISVGEIHSKGSARSANGINIVETIRKCSDILVAVGGHPGAAGFTIETTKIEVFRKRLEEIMDSEIVMDEGTLDIEAEVESSKINLRLVKDLEKFEPFGMENPKPTLATKNMELSNLRTVGSGLPAGRHGKHLKGKADNVDFIAFGMGEMADILGNGQFVDMAYTLEIDKFDGTEKLQLKVRDIKLT